MSASTAADEAACRRSRQRTIVARASTVRASNAVPFDVTVEDLSITGFRFSSHVPIAAGTLISIGLAGAGQASARVAWRNDDSHGCIFDPPLTPAQSTATFSHPTGAYAVVSFVRTSATSAVAVPVHAPRLAFPTRVALIMLASALGWGALAGVLRSLPVF